MIRALFVSDIHISSNEDPKCLLFEQFLDRCLILPATDIFLVGDIFDFWIADRPFLIRTYGRVIEKIVQLKAAGIRLHYFEGNHDLDLRGFWQGRLGVEVHSQAEFFKIGSFNVRVEHGDQMDPEDSGYLFLRWLLRTQPMVALGRKLPEFLIRWLGRRASLTSRAYTTQVKVASDETARLKIRTHAKRIYAAKAFDILVSGHVHVSDNFVHNSDSGTFRSVNLGTWLKQPVVFEITESIAALKTLDSFLQGK